ncbi:MAG: amidase family protein [Sphingomonas sp.]
MLLGKAATAELAYGSTWFGGQVRNPWNLDEPSGGSSAGPAAAVAAGLCGFAIGTDSLDRSSTRPTAAASPGCARPMGGCRCAAACR